MDEQRVRISDIADELGLSTATVSNVINGKNKKVSDETVSRVTELLEKRGYFPHNAAVLMAQNASKIIGVFLNDHEKYEGHTLDDFFISSSLNYLSTEIESRNRFMMVKKAKSAEEIIKFASMWNMDGIVVIGFCSQDYMYLRNHIRIPFVVYDGFCEKPQRILNITIDNYDGGYQMGKHFKELGHRKALCISDNEIGVDRQRIMGFKKGFSPWETCFMLIPMKKERRWQFYRQKLSMIKASTAVFAVSDYYAIDMLCFLKEQGLSVPQDISLAGFDDTPICRMSYPTLTTIMQDGVRRAKLAVESLLKLKENDFTDTEIKLPVELVIRNSTGKLNK